MSVIYKIAARNLVEHKVKTLIIGVIITLGILILVVGNSMMDTATAGIRKTYIDNYTGDIILTPSFEGSLTLFGNQDFSNFDAIIPSLPEYEKIVEHINSIPGVKAVSPQITSMAMVTVDDDNMTMLQLFGIDPDIYQKMFPENIELIEGDWIGPGEKGIMLSENKLNDFASEGKTNLTIGDSLLLTGVFGSGGTKIREVTIRGIFKFTSSNQQLDNVSLLDMDTARSLQGLTIGSALEKELSFEEADFLTQGSEDDLFGGDDDLFGEEIIESVSGSNNNFTEENLLNILGDTSGRDRLSMTDSGAWHFLLIKLDDGVNEKKIIKELGAWFESENLDIRINNWREVAGMAADMSFTIKNIFNIIVFVIAIVAMIIIMNTIVISVTERIGEIGAMRAMGAQKNFIRKLITTETSIISLVFGIVGILLGVIAIIILNLTGISAPNFFFEIIFGGKVLKPILSFSAVSTSLIMVILIGILASLYPVSFALKIEPVKAMQAK